MASHRSAERPETIDELRRALDNALEQQAATAEILKAISRSPTDLHTVLDTVAEHAARLCEADDAEIYRVDGATYRRVAHRGPVPIAGPLGEDYPITRGRPSSRAIIDRRTIHVHDQVAETLTEFPDIKAWPAVASVRTIVATPLLREDTAIGVIVIRRTEVKPFSESQIALLQTFADQAVIALENVRMFQELEEKNQALTEAHAQVSEALERQTATSEILRVISSSPTDVHPVFEALAAHAARLCGAGDVIILRRDRDVLRMGAGVGPLSASVPAGFAFPLTRGSVSGRAIVDRQTLHITDLAAEPEDRFPVGKDLQRRFGHRTMLATPLLQDGNALGVICVFRTEVRPFTDSQIDLLRTFADQAVIALENVRLFKELEARTQALTRSVGELSALGEIGQAISSTLDLPTVLSTIVARASELAGADAGVIYEYDEGREVFVPRATERLEADIVNAMIATPVRKGEGATGRLAQVQEPVQVADIVVARAESRVRDVLVRAGYRTLLAVPLAREGHLLGGLTVIRKTTGEFAPEIIDLLQTFATQSALAIQNARLFRELEIKSRELEVASQHKSEFLASMSHELRTPLNAVIGFSDVLLDGMFGPTNEKQTEYLQDILASGQHLLSLINDILDLSKIEAGRVELDLAEFEVASAVDDALLLMRERAARRGITLTSHVGPDVGTVRADQRKIKQVLLNLLSNAVKFTPEGGRIEVRAARADGRAEVAVSDSGIGIAPEHHEVVFEEFRQVGRADKKAEGTGLGLALCRKFVELHGGRIWVTSQLGQGSVFTFTVPATRDH